MPKHSILLIEDDPTLGFLYQQLLIEAGYYVSWKQSAAEALDHIKDQPQHLVLLDVMLPDMSGVEMLERLGDTVSRTVMLTNLDQSGVQEKVKNQGVLGYIIKSEHTPESFLNEVHRYLGLTNVTQDFPTF